MGLVRIGVSKPSCQEAGRASYLVSGGQEEGRDSRRNSRRKG